MPRGGPRPGAGRKPGSKNKRTIGRELIRKEALRLSITPLDVMLNTMKQRWHQGRLQEACEIAKDAAPYIHRRLASLDGRVRLEVDPIQELLDYVGSQGSGLKPKP